MLMAFSGLIGCDIDGASPRPAGHGAGQRAWHLFAKQGRVLNALEPCGMVAIDAYLSNMICQLTRPDELHRKRELLQLMRFRCGPHHKTSCPDRGTFPKLQTSSFHYTSSAGVSHWHKGKRCVSRVYRCPALAQSRRSASATVQPG